MLGGIGMTEILVIMLIVLLLFGAKRLPELARGVGKGIREFKNEINGLNKSTIVDEGKTN